MLQTLISATFLLAGLAQAGLNDMRATIPGSLHQCQNTSVFFFDTDDNGSKTLLFLNAGDAAKLGSGTIKLSDALSQTQPLQQIGNIDSKDAASTPFFVKVAADTKFSTFGFLSDGQGKNLNLDRTVMRPLPDAIDCLAQVAAPATTAATIPVVKDTSAPAPPATTPASSPSSVVPLASTSGFVKALKPASASSTALPTTPPAVSSAPASTAAPAAPAPVSSVAPAPAVSSADSTTAADPASTAVIQTNYLLTSFITISKEQTTDGTVSSAAILGGHTTGKYNGTILSVGSVLFAPNNTAAQGTIAGVANSKAAAVGNSTVPIEAERPPVVLSATYTFTIDDGKSAGASVFVMAQTPLQVNASLPALLMTLQPAKAGMDSLWANKTVLGKTEYINSTMFRIDAYVA